MISLKRDQDRFNRGELKDIGRKNKDKVEVQRLKRVQNKKHIEQSVKEIQKVTFHWSILTLSLKYRHFTPM